jgi:DNA-directed RNA polymerase specialized sigma24 family protein
VETLLAPLSPLLAETVRRHVLEGYTVEEISVQAGVPIETIRKRRTRAYATLRQRLEAWAKRHHQ